MRRLNRFLSLLMVMTIILTGFSLNFNVSAVYPPDAAFNFIIFSGSSYPDQPCTLSGINTVNGNIHSNYSINANTSVISGIGEAVGTVTGTNIQTKISGAPNIPMPDLSIYKSQIKAEAIAAGHYYTGNFSVANTSAVNLDEPYYIEGSANLSGISFTGMGCLYAGGKITISGSATTYASNSIICLYSGYTTVSKSDIAIDFSGSSKNFMGLLYAPNGSISVAGSYYNFFGNIIGKVVDISGANKTFFQCDTSYSFKYICGYRVNFDANGGTGGHFAIIKYGLELSAPTVTRTGYTFTGWSPAVPATVPAGYNYYTAQWSANTYTVAYNGNGNTGGSTANSTHSYDVSSNLSPNGFTRTGYSFAGWSTNAEASTVTYTDGQNVINLTAEPNQVITLYAVWAVSQYTITFDANGGTGGTTLFLAYGTTLTVPEVTKEGYTFAGWSPEVPDTVPATDTAYTAQWTLDSIIPGDINGNGTITAVDALMVLQAATGRIILTESQITAADVNKSGAVTAVDALMILQYATGRLTSFV